MSDIRIGNAPCSWGTLEFEGASARPIGYSQMLDELAGTGYQGTELGDWGYMPSDSASLHSELQRRQLTLLGAFVPVALRDPSRHVAGEEHALRVAHLLAAVHERAGSDVPPFLVLADDNGADPVRACNAGRVTAEMGLSDADWTIFARGANRVADAVLTHTGLRTVFHHHCAGFVETPEEIATLLERTDPDLLGLVFDTGHLAFGAPSHRGSDVLEAMDRFASRTWYIHFKDCDSQVAGRSRAEGWDYLTSVRQGVFCELGKGCVDFRGVIDRLRRRGYRGWALVEQDVLPGLGAPRESAQRNRDYLRTLGL